MFFDSLEFHSIYLSLADVSAFAGFNSNIKKLGLFAEIGSLELAPEQFCEISHRYVLNLYDILEEITTKFPDVLIEGCAGGGGRYDAGNRRFH